MRVEWAWDGGRFPRDAHGVAVTYQQVVANAEAFAKISYDALVILDEIHHAGVDAAWGNALQSAFEGARHRLALSGTPYRTDRTAIPFVPYDEEGYYVASTVYGYADAVRDGVCRPLACRIADGEAQWIDHRGFEQHATSAQAQLQGDKALRQWLQTQHDVGLEPVLLDAHQELQGMRRTVDPNAAGLIVARDQSHARELAAMISAVSRQDAAVVISDNEGADKDLERFAKGRGQWIVAVHMVSEGVDIPRLRVGVYASHVMTQQYLTQFAGRFVRAGEDRVRGSAAVLYVPAHPTLVQRVQQIEEQVREALAPRGNASKAPQDAIDPSVQVEQSEASQGAAPSPYSALSGGLVNVQERHIGVSADPAGSAEALEEEAPWDRKLRLREEVNDLVNQLHRLSGEPHAKIHGRFSKQFGDSLSDATERTLERRIERLRSAIRRRQVNGSVDTSPYEDYGPASRHTA